VRGGSSIKLTGTKVQYRKGCLVAALHYASGQINATNATGYAYKSVNLDLR
jgi:hypothetical protein